MVLTRIVVEDPGLESVEWEPLSKGVTNAMEELVNEDRELYEFAEKSLIKTAS